VIASLVSLVAGVALVGVSFKKELFVKIVGPALSAQYRVQRRLPNLVEYSERTHISTARVIAIGIGVLLIVLGLVGLLAAAR
jgi:hypothetical protein